MSRARGRVLGWLAPGGRPRPWVRWFGSRFLRYVPGQLTCREFESFVFDYSEDKLSRRQRRMFERHMWLCPMCRVHWRSYVRALELGEQLFASDLELASHVPEELVQAVLAARRTR